MKKKILPPVIAICILFAIICIEATARNLNTNDEIGIPIQVSNLGNNESAGLNEPENIIISMLSSGVNLVDRHPLIEEDGEYRVFVTYLKDQLSNNENDIDTSIAYDIVDKIIDLNKIMNLEHESNFKKMSLDGRELSIQLAKQIYSLCGLELTYNIQGTIVRITNAAGDSLYMNQNPIQKEGFQVDAFMITIVTLMLSLGLCVLIAKKNQILVHSYEMTPASYGSGNLS